MKFSNGYWQLSESLVATHPEEIFDFEVSNDSSQVVAWAPDRTINHAGDTLNRPLFRFALTSPLPDVIGVRVSRHVGKRIASPQFATDGEPQRLDILDTDDWVSMSSGALTAKITKKPWDLTFQADDRILTSSRARATSAIRNTETGEHFMVEQLSLNVGDLVYGLGERFGHLVKNGQVVDIWNSDGGTASEQAYKNVPFYYTTGGYGVFVRQPEKVSFEVASERVSRVQFSVPSHELEYFVIYGPTPKEILQKYTHLTGRAPRLPHWSYGLWLSTSFLTNYDEPAVMELADGMARRDIPLSVLHYDCLWMRPFHWTDLTWDPKSFPDPEGLLQRLHERGLKTSVWINPYLAERSDLFDHAHKHGYLLKHSDGTVYQTDTWQAGMGIIDFTNPDATAWFQDELRKVLKQGVDSFKTDFGESIPTDVVWHDGSDPQRMHNYYSLLYNRAVFEVLEQVRGVGEAVLFARSSTTGGQQYPVHWGGDCYATYEGMEQSIRGGLSLANSGFGYWSHDIGGFEGTPSDAVFKRWTAFGLLSSHSRLHGSASFRVPWAYGEEAVAVMQKFASLRYALLPYFASQAEVVHQNGTPLMRPMMMEFPDDRATWYLERQFMLGSDLLVAPVFNDDGIVDFYLPTGEWTNWFTGERVSGGRWLRERHDFDSLPLYVRPGSIVVTAPGLSDTQFDVSTQELVVNVFDVAEFAETEVPVHDFAGNVIASFTASLQRGELRVTASAPVTNWRVNFATQSVEAKGGETVSISVES